MRLRKKRKKLIIAVIIPVAIVLLAALILSLVYINSIKDDTLINSIRISSLPNKTEYFVGEEFDSTGLRVQVIKVNCDFYFVEADKLTIEGFDSSKADDSVSIKVKFLDHAVYFDVSVIELPTPPPTLNSVTIENLSKTTYSIGDWNAYNIDLMGSYFLCKYSDGSESRIGLEYHNIVNWEPVNAPCVFPLEFEYLERGVLKRVTVNITITE